ncbi:60S ribosomal protein L13 putative [Thamnocephalis sphaerospora]|uniref:60S ribosomal protein L13 putative n=1 Tax=Thamnocephalis sphaerospora TaxID=78915 RepID=A0A4P9XXH4_9FUNG|nr:60S ribosomal protein L13 putative [Thamnocephalis sphaerospora]|eukprot:RKP11085.1 60S ribosomal protein L13 putative [Thamnocephalis sphaerospora]
MKHNNQLQNIHFHKDWQRRVKTWFDQPGRKLRRRQQRARKAALIAPRPVDGQLRPAVHCPTLKYNTKLRAGKGFTHDELKAAGISRAYARSVGIAVDHRRKNRSEESLKRNVHRLKAYHARLVVFPRRKNQPKKGDASAEDLKAAKQLTTPVLPITTPFKQEKARAVTEEEKNTRAYFTLRTVRAAARYAGAIDKRAKAKAEAEANKAGKK